MKKFDQINMIPFIDIMLVLLAIVLTTASFVSRGLINVDLPKTDQATVVTEEDRAPLEIAITEENQLYYQGKLISKEALQEQLTEVETDTPIYLRVDKASVFEHFINVINLLKAKELDNLSIETEMSTS